MPNEVKNDVTDEDIKNFEEAEEAGEVKTGEERKLDSEEVDEKESYEDSEESKNEEEEKDSEESDEDSESDNEVKSSKPEIKEVAGETPKEKALRLEVTRLRRKNREKEQNELLKSEKESGSEEYDNELRELGYDDGQIQTLDKAFDIIGKKKGFVRKDQSYQAMANDTLAEFIEEHPEYSPENDKDDIYWGRFNSILKSDYKLANKTSKELKSIFTRVDRDIKEELGEKVDSKKIDAQKQKIKSVSAGTSSSSKSNEEKIESKKQTKNFVSGGHPGLNFVGFDEEEIEEFTK